MEAYVVPGWPSSVPGHAAAVPHLNRAAGGGALAYKDRVTGQPGTKLAPVGSPAVPQGDRTAQATMGTSASRYGQGFRPSLYYARPEAMFWPGAGMPVSVQSDNLMPVPATDPRGIPARLAIPIVQRGQHQVMSRPVLNTWPDWRSR